MVALILATAMLCSCAAKTQVYRSDDAVQGAKDGKRDANLDYTQGSLKMSTSIAQLNKSTLLQNRLISISDEPSEYIFAYKQEYLKEMNRLESKEAKQALIGLGVVIGILAVIAMW